MINPMDLTGRQFLVTGASSGIGRATAQLLSQLCARVVLVGRDPGRTEETHKSLAGEGHRLEIFDVTRVDEIPGWLHAITAQFGPLDGVVHAAGIHKLMPIRMVSAQALKDVMCVNFEAGFALAKAFRQKGVHNRPGSIVFVSSVMGLAGQAGLSAYAASKGALHAITRVLAAELCGEGIRVNAVAPGCVRTSMSDRVLGLLPPEQRQAFEAMHLLGIGSALDVAYAVAFLLADTGRWITGTTLVVDGGYTAQ
jgi:NAD(P)-dependent dehydrogenase (short-subunit alcohol dehydrogenase family)